MGDLLELLLESVFAHRLDRREAGAARDHDDGLVRVLAQVEAAERPSKRSRSRTLRLLKTWSVKSPPGVWRTWISSAVTPPGCGRVASE